MTPTTSSDAGEPCRRRNCTRPAIGRGLCPEHYGRWLLEHDPLTLPGDTAPPPPQTPWQLSVFAG